MQLMFYFYLFTFLTVFSKIFHLHQAKSKGMLKIRVSGEKKSDLPQPEC